MKIKLATLIVDDSSIILNALPAYKDLNNTGTILHAGNYVKALQLVNQFSPQIILLDIHLPAKVGVKYCGISKEISYPLPLLLISKNITKHYARKSALTISSISFPDLKKSPAL